MTVLPGQVWGPPISARHKGAESVKMMVSMLSGFFYPAAPPIGLGFVDVRDVAQAHSLALLDPRAKGRYIAVSHSLNFLEMVRRIPPTEECLRVSVKNPNALSTETWMRWLGCGSAVPAGWQSMVRFW